MGENEENGHIVIGDEAEPSIKLIVMVKPADAADGIVQMFKRTGRLHRMVDELAHASFAASEGARDGGDEADAEADVVIKEALITFMRELLIMYDGGPVQINHDGTVYETMATVLAGPHQDAQEVGTDETLN